MTHLVNSCGTDLALSPDAQDEASCKYEIERLADGVWDSMPDNAYPLRVIQVSRVISSLLLAALKFIVLDCRP